MKSTPIRLLPSLALLALLILTVVAYAPVRDHAFVHYDDPIYVVANEHIQNGLDGNALRWAFTSGYAANWHPLTWISHMMDVEFFGLGSARAHHLVNLALHLANIALLYCFLRLATGSVVRSWFVAAIFALHPLHVESVAWVSERKDLLSSLFWLASLIAYTRYAQTGRRIHHAFCVGLVALGLLCKSMLVTAPFLLLVLDYWPLRRLTRISWKQHVGEKLPLLLLALASSTVTWLVQREGGAMAMQPLMHRLATALHAYVGYLFKFVWPHPLAPLYPNHVGMWSVGSTLLALALTIALTVFAVRCRRERAILAGWLWYLGTLVPVLGLVQVGRQWMADRYSYVPLIGVSIALAWAVEALLRARPRTRRGAAGFALVVVLGWIPLTRAQVALWRDSPTLFAHALAVTQDNDIMQNNQGSWLVEQGRLNEAVEHFREALRIRVDFEDAQWNLGRTLMQLDRPREAMQPLAALLRLRPDRVDMRLEYARALRAAGQVDAAIAELEILLRIDPAHASAWNNLGSALGSRGRLAAAVRCFESALRLDPGNATAHLNLAFAYESMGELAAAERQLLEALRIDPGSGEARLALERVRAKLAGSG